MPAEVDNNKSAQCHSPLYDKASQQVLAEIQQGNYVVCEDKPTIISPFSVLEKSDGGVRLIHDASQPVGDSLNDQATLDTHYKFETVDSAAKLLWPNYYMAKVDLKSAYRSVKISEHSQKFTGLKWIINNTTVFLKDTKLPFGSKLAPGIFHRLGQSVKRMMERRGFRDLVVYLDDFLVIAPTKQECQLALNTLLKLLRQLGFSINWNKVVDPAKQLIFLGIEIDSQAMCLRLPESKSSALKLELVAFSKRHRATKRQLQSLIGKLNWAAAVVRGGRVFLRRLIDLTNTLRGKTDRVRLSCDTHKDIAWWLTFMEQFNGKSAILDRQPLTSVYTDACQAGGGAVYGQDWIYTNWDLDWPEVSSFHINYKEVLAILVAALRWAPKWANRRIYILSDNTTAVSVINRGTTRHQVVMEGMRCLFWLSAKFNFHLTARHIPGVKNVAADSASRLHEPGQLNKLIGILYGSPCHQCFNIDGHVSSSVFLSFLQTGQLVRRT